MKIGVITFWQSEDNYGQQLQCWALQKYLEAQGHNAYLIRYDVIGRKMYKSRWRYIIKKMLFLDAITYLFRSEEKEKKKVKDTLLKKNKIRQFDFFRKENLRMSERLYRSLKDLQKNPPDANAYITGSDQVWSQSLEYKENETFYLNFGHNVTKRIAYATSFGYDHYPEKLEDKLAVNLKRFDFISVREQSGVSICQKLGYTVKRCVDPTMLLTSITFDTLLQKSVTSRNDRPFVFIYTLNIINKHDVYFDEIKKYADRKEIICTPASGMTLGLELFGDEVRYDYATIPEWLSNIREAELVVTTSFHGVAFCILYHTKFAYVPLKGNKSGQNDRILTLLQSLGLMGRCVENGFQFGQIANTEIEWRIIDEKLETLRTDSRDFLKEALY